MLGFYIGLVGVILLCSVLLWASNLMEVERVLSTSKRMIKGLRHRSKRYRR